MEDKHDEAKNEKHRRHREKQVPVEAQRYQEDRGFGGFRLEQPPILTWVCLSPQAKNALDHMVGGFRVDGQHRPCRYRLCRC
jgi:hypothetical protein